MTVEAFIFDCDGTLVDSETLANEVLVEYLSELGFEMAVDEALRSYTGIKMADCIADLGPRFGADMPALCRRRSRRKTCPK